MASSAVNATSSSNGGNCEETKSSRSKLDVLLKKLHHTADSSTDGGNSDAKSQKSTGSSRRKPKVTRKVVDPSEDDSDGYEYMNTPSRMNGSASPGEQPENGVHPTISLDKDGNETLADGTMVVQPEAVVEKKWCSKGHESRKDRKPKLGDLGSVWCTSCRKQVNPSVKNAVKRHPVLKVLICKECYTFYTSDDFGQDSDGMDNQCRWCGEGGNLIICDYCHNAFCKSCIRRNFGRAALADLEADDGKWRCYVCNSKPLRKLVRECDHVIKVVEAHQESKKHGASSSDHERQRETSKTSAKPSSPLKTLRDIEVTSDNVKEVLSRLTAATSSFSWLIQSFDDDLTQSDHEENRTKIALKLKRGVSAFSKMFVNIENYAKETTKVSKDKSRDRSRKSAHSEKHDRDEDDRASRKQKRLSLPKKKTEGDVICIDEGSSEDEVVPEKRKAKLRKQETNSEGEMLSEKDSSKVSESDSDHGQKVKKESRRSHRKSGEKHKEEEGSRDKMKRRDSKREERRAKDKMEEKKEKHHREEKKEKHRGEEKKEKDQAEERKSKTERNEGKGKGSNKAVRENVKDNEDNEEQMEVDTTTEDVTESQTGSKSPDKEKQSQSHDKEKESKSPDKEKESKSPDKEKVSDSPDKEKVSKSPDKEKQSQSHDKEKESKSHDKESKSHDKESKSQDKEKESKSQDKEKESDSPDKEKESDSPDKDEVNKSPDTERVNYVSLNDDSSSVLGLLDEAGDDPGHDLPDVSVSMDMFDDLSDIENEADNNTVGNLLKDLQTQDSESKDKSDSVQPQSSGDKESKTEECKESGDKLTEDEDEEETVTENKSQTVVTEADKADPGVSKDGKSKDGKSKDEKSKDDKSKDGKSEPNVTNGDESEPEVSKDDKLGGDITVENSDKDNLVEAYKAVLCQSLEVDSDDEAVDDLSSPELSEPEPKSKKGKKSAKSDASSSDSDSKEKRRTSKKKSPRKKDSDSDSEPEFVSSKGKGKGKNSAAAVKERQLKLKLKKSKEDVEKDSEEDDENTVSSSKKKSRSSRQDSSHDKSSDNEAIPRSSADLNAQISLHREMLSEDSSENSDKASDQESSSSSNSSASKGSDYQPGSTLASTPRKRAEAARQKTQDKFSALRKKQEQNKKRKMEKEKERKRREKQRSREMDSDSSDEETEDKKSKRKSPKKKPTKKSKKDSSDESSAEDTKKEKKSSDKKSSKSSAKSKKKRSSSDSDSDEKKKAHANLKVLKIKIKRLEDRSDSSNYDSDLENELAGLESIPRQRKRHRDDTDWVVEGTSKSSKVKKEKEQSESLKEKKKRGKKKTLDIDELSEKDSGGDDEGDEEMEIDKIKSAGDEEGKLLQIEAAQEEERMARSRKQLLASDSSLSDDSSDLLDELKKKKKETQKNGNAETADDSDVAPKSKSSRLRQNKLLNAKFSDSGSDTDRKSKKKKEKDDDFEVSDEDEAKEDEDEDDFKDEVEEDDMDDEDSGDKKKKKLRISELELSDDSDFVDTKKKKKKKKKEASDDEEGKGKKGKGKKKRKRIKAPSSSGSETADSDAPKPKKKRKKKGEESDDDSDLDNTPGKKRKNIKKIMKDKKLSQDTKDAAKAEQERRRRLKEKQKQYNQVEEEDEETGQKQVITTSLTLELDSDDETLIELHKDVVNKLKPHQVEAVQFLWDNLVENLDRLKAESGSGCILAHCMGLGKTLSMISFIHTLLRYEKITKCTTCVVVCPLNTVLNWVNEFEKWIPEDSPIDVYEMTTVKDNWGRADTLRGWMDGGGVLVMGYEMYRNLSQCKRIRNKKLKKAFMETLVDPGPDLVVCDEGHILKNDKSSTSIAMNAVRTKRRVVLTGTPLQNNLTEYHCMVDFVKPSLLGSRKEFCNRFVNPITNGQCADASKWDVKLMKKRAHVLHETLAGCVQRKDYSALTKFLSPKLEFILSIRLSKVQCELYQKYLEIVGRAGTLQKGDVRGASLFSDYQNLSRIWTHPWILKLHEVREQNKRTFDDEDSFLDDESDGEDSFIDDSDSDLSDPGWKKKKKNKDKDKDKDDKEEKGDEPKAGTSSGKRGSDRDSDVEIVKKWNTRSRGKDGLDDDSKDEEEEAVRLSSEWWADYVSEEDQYKLELSGKLMVLAELLKMCEAIGDKVLVFSQSLLSLDLIEDFLEHWDKAAKPENPEEQVAGIQGWTHGSDYFRMDGSTSSALRKRWSEIFNDRENARARLFLISTKAGSLGTNMVGANRCVIFDASWNPTHDVQSIFRVYRFGQTKPVYIYRFLAQGTMEEKIYERQVTKQSLSCRVVDEHQIERHFTAESLQELYLFTAEALDDPNRKERPVPVLPKDRLLAELLTSQKDWIVGYHEHDSLLENQIDEELTEEERKAAWEEYEQEKKGIIRQVANANFMPPPRMYPQYGNMGMPQTPGMNSIGMFPHLTEVARAIRSANPNISMAELQQRLEHYMRLQMASQQQALYQQQQQQQQQQMQRYGGLQYQAGAEPGEVTFLGYGQQGSRPSPSTTAPNLFNVLNGSKKE